jgi:hypothetical protein
VEYGVRTGPVSVDLAAVHERKRAMVSGARENYASRLAQDGPDLVEGEARFTGPRTLEITVTDRRPQHPLRDVRRLGGRINPPVAVAAADNRHPVPPKRSVLILSGP